MGIFSSRVALKFYDEYEKQLSQLDNSLTSLASSVDSIHGTVALLLQELEEIADGEGGEKAQYSRSISLTRSILSSVEGSLYHEKMAFLQGVSQFIHYLTTQSDNKQTMLGHIPSLRRLNIDTYIADFEKKQKAAFNIKMGQVASPVIDAAGSSVDPDRNKSLEDMQQTIDQLKKERDVSEMAKADLIEEKEKCSAEMETFKQAIEKCLAENKNMSETINDLRKENDRLTNHLEKAQHRVEILPVQIYCQRWGELMEMIEVELVTLLNDHLHSENVELEITKCGTSEEIQHNKPLLVLCISTSRLGTDAKNALQGVLQLGYTALLIFHHKDEHALPSQSSDRVLAGPEFKALQGIFDLAFLSRKGMYTCEMNSHAVAGIVDFMYKVSKESYGDQFLSR